MMLADMQGLPILATIRSVVEIGAILVGGFWVYYRFFKGRTFRPSLELSISGRILDLGGNVCLIPRARLKNVGLSDVPITEKGSGIRVLTCAAGSDKPPGEPVNWEVVQVYPVFRAHGWIEPNETIGDEETMVSMLPQVVAFKLELRVVGKKKEWNAQVIIPNIRN